jgi:ribonuclease HI
MASEESLKSLETALLTSSYRRDPDWVGVVLAADFVKVGRSGRQWARQEVIDMMADELPRPTPETDEWEFIPLSRTMMLVTYVVHGEQGASRHASVWDTRVRPPLLRFHQGTMITVPDPHPTPRSA